MSPTVRKSYDPS